MLDSSVIICSDGRSPHLSETLKSVAACVKDIDINTEVLLIDNSVDGVLERVADHWGGSCSIRYVHEPRKGKGFAYNTGIRASNGLALLFTDDDVRVPANWVRAMAAPILAGSTDSVTGRVSFPETHELAIRSAGLWRLRGWFAATEDDAGEQCGLIGANMAIARHVFLTVGGFDEVLGPGGIGFGDETELMIRLQKAGFRLQKRADVVVEHHFSLDRLAPASLKRIAEAMGETSGYLAWHLHGERLVTLHTIILRVIPYLLPRLVLLPILQLVRPDTRSSRLHLVSYMHRLKRNWMEARLPRRSLGVCITGGSESVRESVRALEEKT